MTSKMTNQPANFLWLAMSQDVIRIATTSRLTEAPHARQPRRIRTCSLPPGRWASPRSGPLSSGSTSRRARLGRLSALRVFHSKSVLYGAFVWARRALNIQKRLFPIRAVRGRLPPRFDRGGREPPPRVDRPSEKDAELAQKLGQLQPFIAVLPRECMGQPAYFGPT